MYIIAEPLCRYCGARGHVTAATLVDHIVALSLGGSNDRSNLAPACHACNADKSIVELQCLARRYDLRSVMMDAELSVWIRLSGLTPNV